MPDMLVKLYDLPADEPVVEQLRKDGVEIHRAMAYEKHRVMGFVKANFHIGWVGECDVAFSNHPSSVFIAVKNKKIVGFVCHDATCKNFFGPTGVDESVRGNGVGKALLLACLYAMRSNGYAYAIIGWTILKDYYEKAANAVVTPGSEPGFFPKQLEEI